MEREHALKRFFVMPKPVGGSPAHSDPFNAPGQHPVSGGDASSQIAEGVLHSRESSRPPSLSSHEVQPGGTEPSGVGGERSINSRKEEILQAWKRSLPFCGIFSEADNLIRILSGIDLDQPFTVDLKEPNLLGSISSLPDVFQNCTKFWCTDYSNLKTLPPLPNCQDLWCYNCRSLKTLPDLPNCTRLTIYNNYELRNLPPGPRCTDLDLNFCRSLQKLPLDLTACIKLNIEHCEKLEKLSELPNCRELKCIDCYRLQELPDLTECTELYCTKCYNLKTVQALPKLQKIVFDTNHLDEATRNRIHYIKKVEVTRNKMLNKIKRVEAERSFRSAYKSEKVGDSFKFIQTRSYDEIRELNQEQFPVLQQSFAVIDHHLGKPGSNVCNFFKELGIFVDYSDKSLHFPDKETLEQKLVSFRQKHSDFPLLSIAQVNEIVQPDAFLKILLENDFIYSDPPELIHDICYHLIPMLKRIFLNPNQYEPFRNEVVKTFKELGATLDRAETDFEGFISPINKILQRQELRPITKEEWTLMQGILKYTISACLDNLATVSNIFLPAGQVREYLFQLQKSLIQPSPKIPGQFSGEGWPELWAQELSLSQENLDKVLTIITSGRHVDFLYALYKTPHVQ